MIYVRCPITGKVFSYQNESDIPEGQVFERVNPYPVSVQNAKPVVLFGSSLSDGLVQAVRMAQSQLMA